MYQSCHENLYPRPTDRRFYFSETNGKTIIRTLAQDNNNKIELRSANAGWRLVQSTRVRFIFMKIGIKSAGQLRRAQWPRETARPTVYCISFPTREGRLENIASGHNFLYATMTLQKVAGVDWILLELLQFLLLFYRKRQVSFVQLYIDSYWKEDT